MAGSLGVFEYSEEARVQLTAAENCRLLPVIVPSGAGELKRGTVLAVNGDYKTPQVAPAATDGTEIARVILANDVDATSSDVQALAYGPGAYRGTDIIWPDGISAADKNAALLQLQDRAVIVLP